MVMTIVFVSLRVIAVFGHGGSWRRIAGLIAALDFLWNSIRWEVASAHLLLIVAIKRIKRRKKV